MYVLLEVPTMGEVAADDAVKMVDKVKRLPHFNVHNICWGGGWTSRSIGDAIRKHQPWLSEATHEIRPLVGKGVAMAACRGYEHIKFIRGTTETESDFR